MSKIDNSTKKLLGGSAVYFVGNALTQLISLLLMRFVTGNVTPEEYGFFNLVTTVSNLAIPIVTLQISDAVFKFVLKSETEDEKKSYISVCFAVSFIGICVIFASVFALSCFLNVPHTLLVALYVSSYALIGVYQKITRCLNKNKVFVTGNLLKTVIFLALEIVLISAMDMGIEALLWAHILSLAFAIIYTEIRIHALRYFSFRALSGSVLVKMMRFSVPLIPNAIFWWLTSSVNSVIVSAKLGMDVNGIYAVSAKFTGVLVMVTGVLNMSWQDTAIADYGSRGFNTFLTKTFNTYVKLIFSAIAVLLPFVALVLPYMIDPTYYDSIPYTPFLMMASGMSAMSGFVAQIFTGQGKTKTLLTTSLLGMITNVTVVLALVGSIGLWAAVLGTLGADIVIFGTRTFLARKEFAKGIAYKSFLLVLLMSAIGSVAYLVADPIYNLIWLLISAAIAVIINWRFVCDMLTVLFGSLIIKKQDEYREKKTKNLFIMHTQYNLILSAAVMSRCEDSENTLVLFSEFTLSDEMKTALSGIFDKIIVVTDRHVSQMKTLEEIRFNRKCLKKTRIIKNEKFNNIYMSQERTFDLILCSRAKRINPQAKCYDIEEDAYYSINEKYNADDYVQTLSGTAKLKRFIIRLLYLGYPYNYREYVYCYGMSSEYHGANLLFPQFARRELAEKELIEITSDELCRGIEAIYSGVTTQYPDGDKYTLFFFDLMNRYKNPERVREIVQEIVKVSRKEGRTVLVKYHPRETEKFDNIQGAFELPHLIPAEKVLFDLRGKDVIVVGNATTSCIVSAKLEYDVLSISKIEFPTNRKTHEVMEKMGIRCIEYVREINNIIKKEK